MEVEDWQGSSDTESEEKSGVTPGDKIQNSTNPSASLIEWSANWSMLHRRWSEYHLGVQNPSSAQPGGRLKQWLLVAAIGAVLVTVLTYPTVPRMGSVGRFDNGDGLFSVWNVAWVARTLIEDPRHILDANIFWPHTGTLAYSELNLVGGAMAVPTYLLTHNPVAATNSAIVLALWLSFMCTCALVRRLTLSMSAGVVAGAAYTFCPYLLSHTSHVQLLMAFVIPLMFLALHRLLEQVTWWRGVQLGGAVAIAGLSCGYYGIYGGIALGLGALWLGQRSVAYWRAIGVALVTAAVVVGPVLYVFTAARAEVGGGAKITEKELRSYSSEPIDYVISGARVHHEWQPPFPNRDPLFPGVVASIGAIVALVGAWRGRRLTTSGRVVAGYAAVGIASAWASLGPQAGLYTVLFKLVPAMSFLRAPSRFGLMTTFAASILAAIAISSARRRVLVAAVLTLLVAAENGAQTERWGWPSWPVSEMDPVPHAYTVLATLPRGSVVQYPFPYNSSDLHNHSKAMLASTFHWQPMVNGYSDVIPGDMYAIMLPINGFPDEPSFKIFAERKVRYVIWDLRTYDAVSRATLLARFPAYAKYLKPLVHDDDVWLYEVTGYPE